MCQAQADIFNRDRRRGAGEGQDRADSPTRKRTEDQGQPCGAFQTGQGASEQSGHRG